MRCCGKIHNTNNNIKKSAWYHPKLHSHKKLTMFLAKYLRDFNNSDAIFTGFQAREIFQYESREMKDMEKVEFPPV